MLYRHGFGASFGNEIRETLHIIGDQQQQLVYPVGNFKKITLL